MLGVEIFIVGTEGVFTDGNRIEMGGAPGYAVAEEVITQVTTNPLVYR
ncbi:MAG: hypothetical protein R2831_04700 [Chitinophagaceae bacterium]